MAAPTIALIAISALVAGALWLSLRVADAADLEVLPAHSRRRVRWWQSHHTHVYLVCAAVAAAAGLTQLAA
jgi:hypothetical protein